MIRKGDINMASRKFRFVSPGVFLKEIDNSQLPRTPEGVGPVIIGRTRKGPSMKPYKVRSLEEFERVFGKPMPGNQGEDPWRDGTGLLAESYLPYAARAYLSADIDSPVTVIRLAGVAGDDAAADGPGEPGWVASNAWGLFVMPKDVSSAAADLELAAIFYGASGTTASDFGIKTKGIHASGGAGTPGGSDILTVHNTATQLGADGRFTVQLSASSGTREVSFAFEDIRKDFNTNPVMTNTTISSVVSGTLAEHYWLGETFEENYRKVSSSAGQNGLVAVAMELTDLMDDFKSLDHGLTEAKSGWVFGNDTSGNPLTFSENNQQRLFRIISIQEGFEASRDLLIGIEDIKPARSGAFERFGTFSVVVKRIALSGIVEIERFDNLNLNPESANYIARRIGDVYMEWDSVQKRNKMYGSNLNVSEFIRVEMNSEIEVQGGPINVETVPFGFYGPIVPKTETRANAAMVGSVSVGKFTAEANFAAAGANGRTFRIKTPANTTGLVFTLDSSVTSAAAATANGDGQSHAANPRVGTDSVSGPEAFALAVKAAIEGSTLASDLTVSAPSSAGSDFEITITQKTKGAITTIEHVTTADGNHFTISETSPGAAPVGFSTWATAEVSLSGAVANESNISLKWAQAPLVITGSTEPGQSAGYMFGVTPYKQTYTAGAGTPTREVNKGYVDFVRIMSDYGSLTTDQASGIDGTSGASSYKFTLDEVIITPKTGVTHATLTGPGEVKSVVYATGSRSAHHDTGTISGSWTQHVDRSGSCDLRTLLDIVGGFNMPLAGGNDGVDITQADPFNMGVVNSDATTSTSYAFASIDRAIEMIRDPELVEHNLAAMPGITNTTLTTKLVRTCESRADSLAIIDLPDVYVPPFQAKCSTFKQRVDGTTPEASARNLVARQLNSSYGATYYPWVKVKDEVFNRDVWVPPSVVALGVMAYTEERDDVWFAPAGFNRGGLNTGNAGLPVIQASEQLLAKDRDTLYAANINPVAQFVSEGLVIFGQKTLQSTPSALDRINVRRLLIFVKKEISRISNNLLFEQNVQATWSRFTNQVVPFLKRVKTRFGLSDFKVILDQTTTTPDLVDRNIMYAKVLLKPARSIEFIAVDFVITNTGASFDD